jgi:hypothetical protein
LFEVADNHLVPAPYYQSWDAFFLEGKQALDYNCTYGSPLIWWYWEVPDPEDDGEFSFDMVHLIYAQWFGNVSKFPIRVSKEDEPRIREYRIGEVELLVKHDMRHVL